jgi:hypothetical protein
MVAEDLFDRKNLNGNITHETLRVLDSNPLDCCTAASFRADFRALPQDSEVLIIMLIASS